MSTIGYYICVPFAWLVRLFYNLTNSYGVALILFTLVIKLIMLPFQMKSKKSMMRMSRVSGQMQELQKRYAKNQAKLQEEMQKLYEEEGVNPMSGCLWSLIPFPILIALYSVIRQPLTKMMGLSADAVTQLTDWVTTNAGYVAQTKSAYQEIQITDLIHQNWDAVTSAFGDFSGKLLDIDYSFIGLNMGQQPSFKIWTFDWSNKAVWLPALGLFLIPFLLVLGLTTVSPAAFRRSVSRRLRSSSASRSFSRAMRSASSLSSCLLKTFVRLTSRRMPRMLLTIQ